MSSKAYTPDYGDDPTANDRAIALAMQAAYDGGGAAAHKNDASYTTDRPLAHAADPTNGFYQRSTHSSRVQHGHAFQDHTGQVESDRAMALALQAADAPPCIMEVGGEGDCLFHALNVAMYGPVELEHPSVLRQEICDHLLMSKDNPMRLDGTYGTQAEVGAVCGLRGFEVRVYNEHGNQVYWSTPTPQDQMLHHSPGCVYLICVGVVGGGVHGLTQAKEGLGRHYQPVAHATKATPHEVVRLIKNFQAPLYKAPRSTVGYGPHP